MPYCGEVASSANVDCFGELVDGLRRGWLRSLQNVNASPLPCNSAGTSPLRALVAKAPVALRYAPQKIGIRPSWPHLFCSGPPALASATHGPTGIVPFGHAGDESTLRVRYIGTVNDTLQLFKLRTSPFALQHSVSSSPLVLRLRWAGLATLGRTRSGRRWVFSLETLLGCLLKPDS